jgi:predicted XRE-type DNA-binding protein
MKLKFPKFGTHHEGAGTHDFSIEERNMHTESASGVPSHNVEQATPVTHEILGEAELSKEEEGILTDMQNMTMENVDDAANGNVRANIAVHADVLYATDTELAARFEEYLVYEERASHTISFTDAVAKHGKKVAVAMALLSGLGSIAPAHGYGTGQKMDHVMSYMKNGGIHGNNEKHGTSNMRHMSTRHALTPEEAEAIKQENMIQSERDEALKIEQVEIERLVESGEYQVLKNMLDKEGVPRTGLLSGRRMKLESASRNALNRAQSNLPEQILQRFSTFARERDSYAEYVRLGNERTSKEDKAPTLYKKLLQIAGKKMEASNPPAIEVPYERTPGGARLIREMDDEIIIDQGAHPNFVDIFKQYINARDSYFLENPTYGEKNFQLNLGSKYLEELKLIDAVAVSVITGRCTAGYVMSLR